MTIFLLLKKGNTPKSQAKTTKNTVSLFQKPQRFHLLFSKIGNHMKSLAKPINHSSSLSSVDHSKHQGYQPQPPYFLVLLFSFF